MAAVGHGAPGVDPRSYEYWARKLLDALTCEQSDNNLCAIVAWEAAEGTRAGFNPLATTQVMGDKHDFNSVGVQNYGDFDTGIRATVLTLNNGRYDPILDALKKNRDYVSTARYIDSSPWGTKLCTQIALSIKAGGGKKGAIYKGYANRRINFEDTGAGSSVFNKVPGVGEVKSVLDVTTNFVDTITDPHNWYRVGQVLFGAVLLFMGVLFLAKNRLEKLPVPKGKASPIPKEATA